MLRRSFLWLFLPIPFARRLHGQRLRAFNRYWRNRRTPLVIYGAAEEYDYYVDGIGGNDSNDGLSRSTAWKSLNKIETISFSAGVTQTVLVMEATYNTTSDHFEPQNNSAAGAVLSVTFEPGCIMDGDASSISSAQNPIFSDGSAAWTLVLYGNGLVLKNFDYNVGGASPQGLGNGGNNTILAYDIDILNCVQGISSHNAAVIKMYRGSITNCVAQAIAPVDTSRNELYSVVVDQSAGGQKLADLGETTTSLFEDCWFIGRSAGDNALEIGGGLFRRCRLGTTTANIDIQSIGQGGTLEDCYTNAKILGTCTVSMLRCYGRLTTRYNSTSNITADHCAFVGQASGQTDSVLFQNFSPATQGPWRFTNCIIRGYNVGIGRSFTLATHAAGFVAASNYARYCCLFSNLENIDADLITAGADVSTGQVTSNPLMGAYTNSYVQLDYAITAGSPCLGTGSSGSNIGFSAADLAA